ncbi:LysR substrate-binding domain-containing protein [Zunongwangia sp.]|uniref:LysR family transcriptional regulator n=1 Tax=Zunongwangia sp. TaxID=1965325 RepID=UPI003AA96D73
MFDFKLQVFQSVASRLSFSKAAEDLHITQPAITKHIRQIEAHFNQKLFIRKGNSIALTDAGKLLLSHTKILFQQYEQLEFDMNSLIDNNEGILRIAASTTIAQYVLPEVLAKFHQKFPKIRIHLLNLNTEKVEKSVMDNSVELGFIEGQSKNRELSYEAFLKDEIVLVVDKSHPLAKRNQISISELKDIPLVLREKGSGTREVILKVFQKNNLKIEDLNIELELGSSESIKSYLSNGHSGSLLSVNTVLKELKHGEFYILDIENLEFKRNFFFIQQQGHHSKLNTVFLKFLEHHYNL